MERSTLSEIQMVEQAFSRLLEGWRPPGEWQPGGWGEDHDERLVEHLQELGWMIWGEEPEALPLGMAGAFALGKAIAPLSLIDQAALGGALALNGWVRYATRTSQAAIPLPGGLGWATLPSTGEPIAYLDNWGIYRFPEAALRPEREAPLEEARQRWRAWAAATVSYLAGLAERAFRQALDHTFVRRQFDRPLAAQPVIQQYLSEAATIVKGIQALAWSVPDLPDWAPALIYTGSAAVWVTALAHQLMGAVGFAAETGLHRAYRRAKAMQIWNRGVLAILRQLPSSGLVELPEGLFPGG